MKPLSDKLYLQQLIEEGDPALAHRVSSRRSAVRIRPTYIR